MIIVYNNFSIIISNLRRKIVQMFAGEDKHKKVEVAKKFFPNYVKRRGSSVIYDELAHPQVSQHSISEVLCWFKKTV